MRPESGVVFGPWGAEVAQHDVVWQINAVMPTVCNHQQYAANAIPVKEGVHELSILGQMKTTFKFKS